MKERYKKYFKEDNQKYYITYNGKPISAFYPNGNGSVSSIIPIRTRDRQIYSSEKDAKKYIQYMLDTVKKQDHYINGLQQKLIRYINNLEVTLT